MAKGFRLGRKNVHSQVKNALVRQGEHQYVARKDRKTDQRQLWIERINAVVRAKGSSYSKFIGAMNKKGIVLKKKVLSNVAIAFPAVFDAMFAEITK